MWLKSHSSASDLGSRESTFSRYLPSQPILKEIYGRDTY